MEQGRENDSCKETILERLNRIERQLEALTKTVQSNPPSRKASTAGMQENANTMKANIKWYNALWKQGLGQPQVLEAIRQKMTEDLDACVIGFRDQDQAMINRTFAEFVPLQDGRLFVLPYMNLSEDDVLFIALPYPVNDIWFNRGLSMLERVYTIHGIRDRLNPRVQIGDPAILKRKVTSGGLETVFTPYRSGTMLVE